MTPRFDLISMAVTDMAKSLAFYRRLGLDIPAEADGQPHAEATLPGGLRIAWDTAETIQSFHSGWTMPQGASRTSLAFLCDSPADVDKTHAELVQAGYASGKEPWDAFWGQRYAVVHDPDGNGIDLFAPLPQT